MRQIGAVEVVGDSNTAACKTATFEKLAVQPMKILVRLFMLHKITLVQVLHPFLTWAQSVIRWQ